MEEKEGETADASQNGTNGDATEQQKKESTRMFAEKHDYNAQRLFNKLFNDDILYLLSMVNLWKERTKPTPVNYDGLIADRGWFFGRKYSHVYL